MAILSGYKPYEAQTEVHAAGLDYTLPVLQKRKKGWLYAGSVAVAMWIGVGAAAAAGAFTTTTRTTYGTSCQPTLYYGSFCTSTYYTWWDNGSTMTEKSSAHERRNEC